ncbi:MAG TPA: DUF881 domain-containing protein, partial [Candidatus Binatus sp.]|nr:DUF881 domain-containing protein [Candidatus Binatus sp.]
MTTSAGSPLRRRRLPLVIVAGLLGLLAVGQYRGQVGVPGLADLSVQELGVLVANLNAQNDQLRAEVASLQRQQADLSTAQDRGQVAVTELQSDLGRIRAWGGLSGLAGSGVTITISGPIGPDGVGDLVNELRNAGAEGISIAGVRLVPGVVVSGGVGALAVGGTPLGDGFEILAIGSPQILTGTLTRSGGVVAQLGATYPQARISVTPSEGLVLPATTRNLQPADGHPHL